jgi:hypothetical protein
MAILVHTASTDLPHVFDVWELDDGEDVEYVAKGVNERDKVLTTLSHLAQNSQAPVRS